MKKFLLTTLLFLLASPLVALADECSSLPPSQERVDCLNKILISLGSQAKTLTNQIAAYDAQIKLAILKISQTEDQITTLSTKISALESKLQDRSKLLERQIVQTYKKGPLDPVALLFSAGDFSEVVSRFKYLQIVQATNRKFLYETQKVQANYAQQKDLVQESRKKLQVQKTTLDSIRAERDNLLRQTKSSESIYQKQLKQALLEWEAIQRALANAIKQGPVNAGDPIGLVGNSGYPGCSTGKHLHFEVRVNDTWVNAETYLQSRSVWDDTANSNVSIGSGSWPWPLNGSVRVTQRYGKTPWSYRYAYSGGIHTGIDMTSSDDIIRAPANGTLYSSSQHCGSSTLNIKFIDHGSGVKTFYLHVQ